jgi:hypothetical protein
LEGGPSTRVRRCGSFGRTRIASFNVESLFDRAKALSLPTWQDGRKILEAYAQTNALLNEPVYTAEIKDRLVEQLAVLGLKKEDQPRGGFAMLRQNRGHLVKRTKVGTETKLEIVAEGFSRASASAASVSGLCERPASGV